MKKSTFVKRNVALALAALLTVASASSVFADELKTPDTITCMNFNKIVQADKDTYQPAEIFNFVVEGAGATTYDKETVFAGTTGDVGVADVTTDTKNSGDATYADAFTFDAKYYKIPGIYHYTVTEKAGSNEHITYDTSKKDLYVYVRRNNAGALEVYGAVLVGSDKIKTDTFTNVYKYNKDGDTFKDLTITKKVTGAQGDTTKTFNFKVTVNSVDGRKTYVVNLPNGESATLTAGVPYEFTMTSDQTLRVKNLAEGDTYKVEEATVENYKTTATINGTAYTLNDKAIMTAAENAVVVTNNRDAATATGIIMNVAPYVLMILIAAVAGVVFFRRKKREA